MINSLIYRFSTNSSCICSLIPRSRVPGFYQTKGLSHQEVRCEFLYLCLGLQIRGCTLGIRIHNIAITNRHHEAEIQIQSDLAILDDRNSALFVRYSKASGIKNGTSPQAGGKRVTWAPRTLILLYNGGMVTLE